jgi:4'-phosphopantetheinyl transferase
MVYTASPMLSLPTAANVDVWWTRPDIGMDADLVHRYEQLLADDERQRYHRFVRHEDRRSHLVARALVRLTLASYTGSDPAALRFSPGPHGKPEVVGPPGARLPRFNLSHSRGLIALAVTSDDDVGLDVEHVERQVDCLELARRFFAPREAAHVAAVDSVERHRVFFDYWTLKEAFVKATGLGLSVPLESFWFDLSDPPVASFADAPRDVGRDWQFARLALGPDHAAALAVRCGDTRPIVTIRQKTP